MKHTGGGHKIRFNLIDLQRKLTNIKGVVLRINEDVNRNSKIALIYYPKYGLFSYILSPNGLKLGDEIISKQTLKQKLIFNIGSTFTLNDIPVSTKIHNVEFNSKKIGKIARSAGTYATVFRKFMKGSLSDKFIGIKLPSNKEIFLPRYCLASIGEVSNKLHKFSKIGKAGLNRIKGIRPTVRGVAMNPIDHPHGGGEGKTSGGRISVSFKGKLTKGSKTLCLKLRRKKVAIIRKINKLGNIFNY